MGAEVANFVKGQFLDGYITIGDSVDYLTNSRCSDVYDSGYYTCTQPLHGRYIAYI